MKIETKTPDGVYMLDVAATIYPASRNANWNNVYRMAVVLKKDVEPDLLRQAVRDIWDRIPSMCVNIRQGLFWYYLQSVDYTDIVSEESEYPARHMDVFNDNKPLWRVLYYKRRISVECCHIIADGGACVNVIRSLVARYLQLTGVELEFTDDMLKLDEKSTPQEVSDDFKKNYVPMKGLKRQEENSTQYVAKVTPNYLKYTHGLVPISALKAQAKSYSLSITEYLLAVYLYAFYTDCSGKSKKPIKVSVPVSLRPVFGSVTMRNFSSFGNIAIYPSNKTYAFEAIVEEIRGKIAEVAKKENLQKDISKNVGDATNPIVRFMPNAVKRQVLKLGFKYKGQNKMISTISNLGIFALPEPAMQCVERVEIALSELPQKSIGCALVSFNGFMNISFSGHTKETRIEKLFFTFLSSAGIPVRVECSDTEVCG